MEIKGVAVRPTPLFVRARFVQRFDGWLDSLPPESRVIMAADVDTDAWYPLKFAAIEPTRAICEMFFSGEKSGAREVGRFSAEYALWGLYQKFVQPGAPKILIEQTAVIFSSYYRPGRMVVRENLPDSAVIELEGFPESNELLEVRIGGWMERALEISGCLRVQLEITKSLCRGDPVTRFVAAWR